MDRLILGILAALTIAGTTRAASRPPVPEIGRYKAHVATLASEEFGGRRGPGASKAAAYIAREFRRLDLEPLFAGRFFQEVTDSRGGVLGRNVGARLVGSDPSLRDEWIIVSAHFDHLGRSGPAYFPGADDNASGVAMMLEVARSLARSEARPRRSVMFVGFDLEEDGLWGSRFFVDHPPAPIDRVKLFVTADMIGRALGGVCDEFVFAFGSETSPGMKSYLDRAMQGETIRLALMGNDLLMVDRSDYGPFRKRSIPYLFFTTGENPAYHRWSDTSDTLDYAKALATTRIIHGVIRQAVEADTLPEWNGKTEPSLDEAIAVRDVLKILHDHRVKLEIGGAPLVVLRSTIGTLDGIIARLKITPEERGRLVMAARLVMMSVL